MPDLLFIYGTLHPDRAPAEIAATARRLVPIGPATVRARLYQLGAFPGIILNDPDPDTISGEVFLVPDTQILAQLDAYEDFHPNDIAASLFLRVATEVNFANGDRTTCWVYVYNQPLPSTTE